MTSAGGSTSSLLEEEVPVVERAKWSARSRVGAIAWITAVAVAAFGLSAVASGAPTRATGGVAAPAPAPLLDYVDPGLPAAQQVDDWLADGRTGDADVLRRIADQPVAMWATFGGGDDVRTKVDRYVSSAAGAGRGALIVLYGIPDRDCGGASGGGAGSEEAYQRYVGNVVTGIGGRRATVIVEPDAVPHAVAGCAGLDVDQRYRLIAGAANRLRRSGPVRVYLDAGNPGFVTDVPQLADALQRAGLDAADGFSLNVANFYSTDDNVAFGERLSAATGGKHFVIDTSRNGNGPEAADGAGNGGDGAPTWCNPPGRALGAPPTEYPGPAPVDAWLWVKNPGESDGSCRSGEPGAGQWFPAYALDLARGSS
jgi:endoglucanase